MAATPLSNTVPLVAHALEAYPTLWEQVGDSLHRQFARISERGGAFVGRGEIVVNVLEEIAQLPGGLITIEGPVGSGVTSLLCYLSTMLPGAIWLGDDDAGQGIPALCAQLIALAQLPVPLVPPAAVSDAAVVERLLIQAAQSDSPVSLLFIDAATPTAQPLVPQPPLLPACLPSGMVIVYGCATDTGGRVVLPAEWGTPTLRVSLAIPAPLTNDLRAMLPTTLSGELQAALLEHCAGNLLYLRLATSLLDSGILSPDRLPIGLDALHSYWWEQLDATGQKLALLLAAAVVPLPDDLCRALLGTEALPLLQRWGRLVERQTVAEGSASVFYHPATRAFLAERAQAELAATHATFVRILTPVLEQAIVPNAVVYMQPGDSTSYAYSQYARHLALSGLAVPATADALQLVLSKNWSRFQRRRGATGAAANDAVWVLRRIACDGPALHTIQAAFLAGNLATLARHLPLEAPAQILSQALGTATRDSVAKGLIALSEQLPDGRDKAGLLRRLGEVCYSGRMRTSAMRLLSQALDLEEHDPPRSWIDEREQVLESLAKVALEQGDVRVALAIGKLIRRADRRAMIETAVVRALLRTGAVERAEQLVQAMSHDGMREWALAEVAVAYAQQGALPLSEQLLSHLTVNTAIAWLQIELACYEAADNERAAIARIDQLVVESQRDRGRARLARALAEANKDGDALHVAGQISDVALRVSALLDLRLKLEGLVAMLALEEATSAISKLTGDDRVPLMGALASAHAALGRQQRAVSIAEQLTEGEERDRALARVVVSLAAAGRRAEARSLAEQLSDDDERDWAYDELTRLLANEGRWEEAHTVGRLIVAPAQRAHTLAELYIEQARHSDPLTAYTFALAIEHVAERARALTAIAPILVAADHVADAIGGERYLETPDAQSRYQSAVVVALAARIATTSRRTVQPLWLQARDLARRIVRPSERVRALVALAFALRVERSLAQYMLGEALLVAARSRALVLRAIEQAAAVVVHVEGVAALEGLATIVDEVDSW